MPSRQNVSDSKCRVSIHTKLLKFLSVLLTHKHAAYRGRYRKEEESLSIHGTSRYDSVNSFTNTLLERTRALLRASTLYRI